MGSGHPSPKLFVSFLSSAIRMYLFEAEATTFSLSKAAPPPLMA
jgi:hypothetical protein